MNLAEVMAAAIVLACACSGSLQIWAASAAASHSLAARQEQLVRLDGALLAAEARLRQPLSVAPAGDCAAAAEAMAAQAEQLPLPEGLQRQLRPEAAGVWLQVRGDGLPPRQRWLDAAALGHCAATPEATGDGTSL